SDEVPGDHEEHVDADEAARSERRKGVENQNRNDGKGAEPVDVRPVSQAVPSTCRIPYTRNARSSKRTVIGLRRCLGGACHLAQTDGLVGGGKWVSRRHASGAC